MDYTRQPIIETIITPKEGCKLVVRSSKSVGQEEYFVDAVEVVSFGNALFFRSVERPKVFLVPATDYEVLEVREARMVLKNVGVERNIKIGGGKEAGGGGRAPKEPPAQPEQEPSRAAPVAQEAQTPSEGRLDKRRDKRRQVRRRRGGRDEEIVRETGATIPLEQPVGIAAAPPEHFGDRQEGEALPVPSYASTLLPPPSMLISETIARYRENALFKEAFYSKEDQEQRESMGSEESDQPHPEDVLEALSMQDLNLEPPAYGSLGTLEEGFIPPIENDKD